MSDQALDALSASLGSRKSEPELDLSSLKEVAEVGPGDAEGGVGSRKLLTISELVHILPCS